MVNSGNLPKSLLILMRQNCRSFAIVLGWALLLGVAPLCAQNPPSAEEQYKQVVRFIAGRDFASALATARQLIERANEPERIYYRVVQAAREVGNLELAKELFEGLLAASPPNSRGHFGLGLYYDEKRNYTAAIENYRRCLEALPEFQPPIFPLLNAYRRAGKTSEAKRYLQALLATAPDSATAHMGTGYYLMLQSRFDDANREMEIAQSLNPGMVDACHWRIFGLITAERYQDAREMLQKCLPPLEPTLNIEQRKSFNLQQGTVYGYLGEYTRAVRHIEQSIQLSREIGDLNYEEQALGLLGNVHLRHDQLRSARTALTQALALAQRDRRQHVIFYYLADLAKLYVRLGEMRSAVQYYEQALAKAPTLDTQLGLLANTGRLFAALDEQARALFCFERLVELERQSAAHRPRVIVPEAEAFIQTNKGNYPQAVEAFRAALEIARSGGNSDQELTLLNSLGELFFRIKDWGRASDVFGQAAQLADRRSAPRQGWRAYLGLGRVLEQQSKLEEATAAYCQAIELIESVRASFAAGEDTSYFLHDKTEPYRRAMTTLMRLKVAADAAGEKARAKQLIAEAFHLGERERARTLIESIEVAAGSLGQKLSPDLQQKHWELQARFSLQDAQLRQAASAQKPDLERIKQLEVAIQQTAFEFQQWRQEVRQRNPHLADLRYPEPLTVEQVQQLLKQP